MIYRREPLPNGQDLAGYVERELEAVEKALAGASDFLLLKELHVEPGRKRAGMVVLADGTDWDPGDGAGFYGYYNGAWNKLG